MNDKVKVIVSVTGGVLGYLFGGMDMLLEAFCIILILDTLTGMVKHYSKGTYKSCEFRNGLWKKCGYMIAIVLSVQLDKIMGDTGALRSAILFLLIANEGTSIIENLGEMGIVFPKPIIDAIAVLKNRSIDENKTK